MIFKNRVEAGRRLATQLTQFQTDQNVIVLGLPRGGVVVAAEVAKQLQLPIDVICPRKIGVPFYPELALGAVTENGQTFYNDQLLAQFNLGDKEVKDLTEKARQQAIIQSKLFRANKPPLDCRNKKIIICDDGLATGATMQAAIIDLKERAVSHIIVAIPVAPAEKIKDLTSVVDEVVCLEPATYFLSVGQFYESFEQTSDAEVLALLNK